MSIVNDQLRDVISSLTVQQCNKRVQMHGGEDCTVEDCLQQFEWALQNRSTCDEVIAKQPTAFADAYEAAYARELLLRSANTVNDNQAADTEPTCKLGFSPIRRKPSSGVKQGSKCYGCGGQHLRKDSKFKNEKCYVCGKVGHISKLPVTASVVARETRKDQHLGKILQILESAQCLTRNGYKSPECKYELSSGCITFEHRVVIPTKLQKLILDELHRAHLGIVKMKGIARSFVYWQSGIDKDIKNAARTCEFCAKHANQPPKCFDHNWEYPKSPWEHIHIDYAGPFEGAMLLIVTDAYSK
ncbi:uncharacterized protein K02A2.6-like, partial [Drosophila montana]|uniref:uncharacterized protein K02A2.6-like n=1 Tax=Drosophila montana TaxID=40370 RepID=UPI00313E8683